MSMNPIISSCDQQVVSSIASRLTNADPLRDHFFTITKFPTSSLHMVRRTLLTMCNGEKLIFATMTNAVLVESPSASHLCSFHFRLLRSFKFIF